MKHALTLIGNSAKPLKPEHLDAARAIVGAAETVMLDEGLAADLLFEHENAVALEPALREALAPEGLDLVLQPANDRRKKLLIADMDSTIIQQECIDELAEELGLRAQISEITERAMRGEISFEPALRERVGLLKGLALDKLQHVFDTRIELTPGARQLVQTMRAHGAATALVSGGFTFFTARVAEITGFQHQQANELHDDGAALTGTVGEPILGKEAKLAALRGFREQYGLAVGETLAVGDGANDLAMIGEAGLGVAFHAKPAVAAAAHARIDHGDLTALLYLQGYKRREFAES